MSTAAPEAAGSYSTGRESSPSRRREGEPIVCTRDERGRLTVAGVPLTSRGPLDTYFDGLLFDRSDWLTTLGDATEGDPSPASIVLAAYERFGEPALAKLRGTFVAMVLDRRQNRIFVVRDPIGSQPLFYARTPRGWTFASSIAPLLATAGVSRDLNRAALAEQLCNRWSDREETFFAGVRRVPPGWRAEIQGSRLTVRRYWDPVAGGIEWLTASEAERFDEHLDRAVRRCLESGRTGIFLSGGFDSVSVAAVAADEARRHGFDVPRALSLGFPAPECDERLVQTSVARTLDIPLQLVDFREAVGPRGLFASALELNRGLQAPLLNTWSPAYLSLVRRASQDGVRNILTGSGGDEWLGVTPYLAADLIRSGNLTGLYRMARMWQRSYQQGWPQVLRGSIWTYGLRPLAGAAMDRAASDWWQKRRRHKLMASDPAWVGPDPGVRESQHERAATNLAESSPPDGFYARESRTFLDHALMSWEFEEQFEFGRPFGVRYLHPYWDVDLLSHVYRTPPEILNRGGRSKGQVREVVARRFPALGFERQRKVSALNFFVSTLAREGPRLAEAVRDYRGLAALGVVDPAGARAYVERAFTGTPAPLEISKAWNLINLETWTRQYS